ncbi:hypothetical protein B0H16DRAFT_1887708 [Mycena metata]|uniref:Uncharacterized protein n=1 Tax=Mycena metata TaxID=1033252 RepID=A0AAD7N852_9AGAR|nr:hypothetical protein B0H16DRAFT_1887708 [Mycena metata]
MSTQRRSLVSPYQHDRTSTARTSPQPQPQPPRRLARTVHRRLTRLREQRRVHPTCRPASCLAAATPTRAADAAARAAATRPAGALRVRHALPAWRVHLAAYAYARRRRCVRWWRVRCSGQRVILRVLVFAAGRSWARVLGGLVCWGAACAGAAGCIRFIPFYPRARGFRIAFASAALTLARSNYSFDPCACPRVPTSLPPLHFRLAALSLAASSPSFLEMFFSPLPSCVYRTHVAAAARRCMHAYSAGGAGCGMRTPRTGHTPAPAGTTWRATYTHAAAVWTGTTRVGGGRRTCGQGGDIHRAARTGTGTTPPRPLVGLGIRAVKGAFFFLRAHLLCLVLPLSERTPHAAQMRASETTLSMRLAPSTAGAS